MLADHEYRVIVVGGGSISQLHAQALQVTPGAKLVAFVGGDGARMRSEEFGAGYAPDLATAVREHGPDIAVICTPTGTHAQLGVEAAMLGLNVLVEKAIDTTVSAAQALIDTCHDRGVLLGVVSQGQFEPEFAELLSAVEAGTLGPLTLGSAARKCWRDPEYYRGWHGTPAMEGGGALINQAIHKVDQLCRLMGPARRVTGWTRTQVHRIDVEDTALALIEFANGAVGTIEATTAFYSSGKTPPEQTTVDTLQVSGATGSAVLDKGMLTKTWAQPAVAPLVCPGTHSARLDLFVRQHEDFIDALARNRPPRVTGEHGLRALELVVAVYKSARTGLPVEIGSSEKF